MNTREVGFVFPLLNSIAIRTDISPDRIAFLTSFVNKLKPIIDATNIKQTELIIKHGERFGDLERFRLKTKQQNDDFKAEMKLFKDQTVDPKLTKEEQTLFDQLLYQALTSGYEDYPEI